MKAYRCAVVLGLAVQVIFFGGGESWAFSRGLTSKVRQMQSQAYLERLENAKKACDSGSYEICAREGELALQHAATNEKAAWVHKILVFAYTRLKQPAAASPHQEWLNQHR